MTTQRRTALHRCGLAADDRRISEELRDRILAARGDQVRRIILYGSRAQGRAAPDSDFNLLVVEADKVEHYSLSAGKLLESKEHSDAERIQGG